jgi:ribosome maturation factor RimP
MGHIARVNLGTKLDGRRKLSGKITGVGADFVTMDVEGREFKVPAGAIEQARLVPGPDDYNFAKRKRED